MVKLVINAVQDWTSSEYCLSQLNKNKSGSVMHTWKVKKIRKKKSFLSKADLKGVHNFKTNLSSTRQNIIFYQIQSKLTKENCSLKKRSQKLIEQKLDMFDNKYDKPLTVTIC